MSDPPSENEPTTEPVGPDSRRQDADAHETGRQRRDKRLRRFRGPALAAGGFALISPLGLGFAAGVTAVAAGILYMSRRSAKSANDPKKLARREGAGRPMRASNKRQEPEQ